MSKKENTEVEATEEAPKTKMRVKGVSQDAALTVLVDSNPKRAGSASYDRFEGYLQSPAPTTVKEALENGLTMGDIHYDIIHKSISVDGAEIEEYVPTPRGSKSEDGAEPAEAVEAEAEGEDNF